MCDSCEALIMPGISFILVPKANVQNLNAILGATALKGFIGLYQVDCNKISNLPSKEITVLIIYHNALMYNGGGGAKNDDFLFFE